jgi:hypothetical protein
MRGGRDNDPEYHTRMRGQGPFAELLRRRFEVGCRRYGFRRTRELRLDCSRFVPPRPRSPQGELF